MKTDNTTIEVQGVGRVLSSRNSKRLEDLFEELGRILLDAKVVTPEDLKALLDRKDEISEEAAEVSAGGFLDDARTVAWEQSLHKALDMFRFRVMDIYRYREEELPSDKSRQQMVDSMIDDLHTFLKEHFQDVPLTDRKVLSPAIGFMAEAQEEVEASEELTEEIQISVSLDFPTQVEASTNRGSGRRSRKADTNRQPFAGVLFRIDEPSEAAPAKGPAVPLYVPLSVAQEAMRSVVEAKGLPLDVDESLSRHAQESIAGVMTDAEISGNDFIVRGHLFPWSQSNKVGLIAAERDRLGMSMNANATGRKQMLNGRPVFWIDHLELLGANILLAEKATYRKTKVLTAQAAPENQETFAISAQGEDMDIVEQLNSMSRTLTEIAAAASRESDSNRDIFDKIGDRLSEQEKILQEILEERKQRERQLQAQSQEAELQSRQSALVEALSQVVDNKLQQQKNEILDIVNPTRSPRQLTSRPIPLVQASAGSVPQTREEIMAAELHQELHDCNVALDALRQTNVPGPQRAKLIERISQIKRQLGVA